MFDLVFNSFVAFQQAGLLVMALVCVGLGGVLLAHDLHWRLRAMRVEGTVIGVREKNKNTYRAVYRYVLPSGQLAEATSNMGSSSVRDKETGRTVALRVFPERPDEVQEADSVFVALFGVALIALGAWPLHAAFTAFAVTPATWIVLAVLLLYGANRIRAKIIPKQLRLSPAAWQTQRRERRQRELATLPVRPIEQILAEPARAAQAERAQRVFRKWSPVIFVIGLASLFGAYHLGQQLQVLKGTGLRTHGVVVALQASTGEDTTYSPIVEFETGADHVLRFKDRVSSNPPSHHTGEQVTVLYAKDSPQTTAMIDRGIWNWLPSAILLLLGVVLSALGARGMTRS
ncbi:MAG: DUF3592 domain-containing protein [Steroidobacteraceae bacterium]